MITVKEFYETLIDLQEQYEDEDYIGVRWEDLDRQTGDEVGCSKHNLDREHEDDMPEYGTEEYEDLFELDGASSLDIDFVLDHIKHTYRSDPEKMMNAMYMGYHCYLIIGTGSSNHSDGIDDGEIVVVDAKVAHKFY